MSKVQEFNAHLVEQLENGSIYVLGAQGQTGGEITEAWIKKREHNKAANYTRAIALWLKRLAAGFKNLRAWDCSGLGVYKLMKMGLYKSDTTAHGMYKKSTPVSRSNIKVGDRGFRVSGGRAFHVGYVVKIVNGVPWLIESKGRDDGVVERSINASGTTYWTHFGRPDEFADEINTDGSYTRMLRLVVPFMQGDDVKKVQERLKWLGLFKGAVKGNYGPLTRKAVKAFQTIKGLERDGVVGPITWEALGL